MTDDRGQMKNLADVLSVVRPLSSVVRHFIACGLIGEPVPPVMMSGGPQKKNS